MTSAAIPRMAVLVMEMQRGIVGKGSYIPALAEAVETQNIIVKIARLLKAARSTALPVIHCTFEMPGVRGDWRPNCPLLRRVDRTPDYMVTGSAPAEILPELHRPRDLVIPRDNGISPFRDTTLAARLKALDIDTLVATGVSLNLALFGMCVDGVALGFKMILAEDCAAGFPTIYARQMLQYSFPAVACVVRSDDLLANWAAGAALRG